MPLEEWNFNQRGKCSLFVQLYMLKVVLGTLSWCALVVCKLVPVACQTVSIGPCIGPARTATLQSELVHVG